MIIQAQDCYVLIDLGGTHLRITIWPTLEPMPTMQVEQFVLSHQFGADFDRLLQLIKQQLNGRRVKAVGWALPGLLNADKTSLDRAHNLPEWVQQPVSAVLQQEFSCPVFMDNDAVAAALAETYFGGAKEDFLLTIWGTGVGGALVHQDQTVQVEKTDYHKYLAAIEQKCGGKAIVSRFGKPAKELSDAEWTEVITDFLSRIKTVAQKLQLNQVIAGGGTAIKQKHRLESLAKPIFDQAMKFSVSSLGDAQSFGLYGAAALIKRGQEE